jgi:hypothetical protein
MQLLAALAGQHCMNRSAIAAVRSLATAISTWSNNGILAVIEVNAIPLWRFSGTKHPGGR